MSTPRAVALVLLITACGNSTEAPTAPDPALVAALVDLHLADARAETTGENRDSLRAAALARHGLDTTSVHRTLDRLAERPEEAALLFQHVTDSLTAERAGS